MTIKSTNIVPTIDKTVHKKEMKRKVGNQASFLFYAAKLVFTYFKQASILYYFEPKCHIYIETNASKYTIIEVLSQISLKQQFFNKQELKFSKSDFD